MNKKTGCSCVEQEKSNRRQTNVPAETPTVVVAKSVFQYAPRLTSVADNFKDSLQSFLEVFIVVGGLVLCYS